MRWRALDDVRSGRRDFNAAAGQFRDATRAKVQDFEGLLQVGR